jgi:hypothetical protein
LALNFLLATIIGYYFLRADSWSTDAEVRVIHEIAGVAIYEIHVELHKS